MVILPGAMDQATWIGNATAQMSALVLLLGALLLLGDIAWLLLRCFCCVVWGSWRLDVLTAYMHGWLPYECCARLQFGSWQR